MSSGSGECQGAALSGDIREFSDYLASTGQPFLVQGEPGPQSAHVRFTGRLQGREVVWNCEFVTLQSELERLAGRAGPAAPDSVRGFIEIGEPCERGVPLRVGLNLERIDYPAILKMIVMIRNYKRLRPGRHEFGEPYRKAD